MSKKLPIAGDELPRQLVELVTMITDRAEHPEYWPLSSEDQIRFIRLVIRIAIDIKSLPEYKNLARLSLSEKKK